MQTHKHTGPVYAFTTSGAWKYKESDFVNRAGSFLYEPAGSVHTLIVPDDNTEPTDVFFAIWGANLNLDADGNVESIVDAGGILQAYYMLCEAEGLPEARRRARLTTSLRSLRPCLTPSSSYGTSAPSSRRATSTP